jgi:hypothetical protein
VFDLNPFEKVAEAARALRRSDDPRLQAALTDLRNLWITVANEGDLATATRLVEEVASIERLHGDLIRKDAPIFHSRTPARRGQYVYGKAGVGGGGLP